MANIIETGDVAAYLQSDAFSGTRADLIVELVNGLLAEKWINPVDPPPTTVRVLALDMAARAWHTTPGRGQVESVTRSFDDSSRTERYAVEKQALRSTVYITEDELAMLNGNPAGRRLRPRSIGLRVPGFTDV